MWGYMHMMQLPQQRLKEGFRSSGAGVTNDHELSNKGTRNSTPVLWKNNTCFNHWPIPSIPWFTFLSEGTLSCFLLAIKYRAKIHRGNKAVLIWRFVGQWESKFLLLSTETWTQHLGLWNETSCTDYEENSQSLVLKGIMKASELTYMKEYMQRIREILELLWWRERENDKQQ